MQDNADRDNNASCKFFLSLHFEFGMKRKATETIEKKQLKISKTSELKGLFHEDFAILGQFCAKIIT